MRDVAGESLKYGASFELSLRDASLAGFGRPQFDGRKIW